MTASSRLEPSLPPSRSNPHQDTSDAFETCANVIKAIQGHILARAAYVRAIQTAAAVERPNAARAAMRLLLALLRQRLKSSLRFREAEDPTPQFRANYAPSGTSTVGRQVAGKRAYR